MYFFKFKGEQYLDLRGNLVLSHNPNVVRTRVKSAAPHKVHNLETCIMVRDLTTLRAKLKALWVCAVFIFDSKCSKELKQETLFKEIDEGKE